MHTKEHAQKFKDERMERMTGKKSMPNPPNEKGKAEFEKNKKK